MIFAQSTKGMIMDLLGTALGRTFGWMVKQFVSRWDDMISSVPELEEVLEFPEELGYFTADALRLPERVKTYEDFMAFIGGVHRADS